MPAIVWFRRVFRLRDQTLLFHACKNVADGVVPVFIFDDAAMRQLNTTGWMHNRLRMIVAMFQRSE